MSPISRRVLPALFLLVLLVASEASAEGVLALSLDGAITPASDNIVGMAIEEAETSGAEAILLLLDTPGGGLAETLEIISMMERTDLPVIAYVYPESASAWSAGTVILMASDVAAMAPHTIIGSAQPVSLSPTGGTEPINDSKTLNAVVALITEKAERHGRNATAAEAFVIQNLNLNASAALDYGVIEVVSDSPEDLLAKIDGMEAKNATLNTSGLDINYFEPPASLAFLKILSDPMIAGLLLLIGLYALIFGLSSPGAGAEVFGIIALSLGLIGLGFDVNLGALFLIAVGAALVLLELHSQSFGVMAAAGLLCIIAGSILLVPTSYPDWYLPGEYQRAMAMAFVLPSLILGGFLAFAVYKVAKIRVARPVIGELIGEEAEVADAIAPSSRGFILYQGEYWKAESDESLAAGDRVIIVGKRGSVLKVKKI